MNTKQNLHTHTTYCDGKDTPRQMIETAIEKGFGSLGFSGHAYTDFSSEFTMTEQSTLDYKSEITRLKAEYADRIEIFLGLEYDMLSQTSLDGYDYLIGTVHSLKTDIGIAPFDRDAKTVQSIIDNFFQGDGMKYAECYFEHLSRLKNHGKFDILGHFDIITKHSENVTFFDTDSKKYLHMATDAMDSLKGAIPFFEVNTGAISRGYRTTPYPAPKLIKELRARGFEPIITSDCHMRNALDCYFDQAAELLKACGFENRYILTKNGFKAVKL